MGEKKRCLWRSVKPAQKGDVFSRLAAVSFPPGVWDSSSCTRSFVFLEKHRFCLVRDVRKDRSCNKHRETDRGCAHVRRLLDPLLELHTGSFLRPESSRRVRFAGTKTPAKRKTRGKGCVCVGIKFPWVYPALVSFPAWETLFAVWVARFSSRCMHPAVLALECSPDTLLA